MEEEKQSTTASPPASPEKEKIVVEEPKTKVAAEDKSQPSSPEKAKMNLPKQEEDAGTDWWGGMGGWINTESLNKAVSSVTEVTNSAVSSAVNVAKTKSTEVYGLVAKDLGEVSTQATTVVGSTATTIKKSLEEFDEKTDVLADKAVDSVKKSVSSFWNYASGYAQQMFTEDDLEAEAVLVGKDSKPVLLDRLQAQLHALAADSGTFLNDPDEKEKAKWDEFKVDLDKRQGEISDLMVNDPKIRQHYTDFVPDKVSHKVFWTRYFFKVHLIELQEAKRQALKKRAEQRVEVDSEMTWGDVDDLVSEVNSAEVKIPDEVQDKLLSDYEQELKSKKGANEAEKILAEELDKVSIKPATSGAAATGSDRSSPEEKESTASDDWENLSAGERSPRKTGKEDEDWVKT